MKSNMNQESIRLATLGLALMCGLMIGCETTRRASPLVTDYDQQNAEAELDFWHGLADQPITTNNDAFHGLIEFDQGNDPMRTYEDRVSWLVDSGYLDPGFAGEADEAVQRGTVAQVLARMLEIDGGVTMRIVGAHPRYATRELVYLQIMRRGSDQQGLSGIQFVGLIGRAHDFNGRVP
jgi:hypothetical protein